MVGSDWDMPSGARNAPASSRARVIDRRGASGSDGNGWTNGLIDPVALLAWLLRNLLPIALLAIVLTTLGVGAVLLMSFPYSATAIVLADPRDQRITLQEEVLPSIGADAAVLESMVQIVRSDGFLLDVMRNLGIGQGADVAVDREAELRELARFRSNLQVERKGATYLVEISYRGSTPEEAARIANGIAGAFADSQNDSRVFATQSAAQSLADQLVEVRARLTESEEAVARFRAENGIVYVDDRNTVQMRQLGELNQQLALVRNATEEARARYEEHRSGGALTRGGQGSEGGQLEFLRQQRAQLMQLRDQQLQVYGPRHPRLVQTQQTLDGVEREIASERVLLADQLKAELDVAVAKQAQMEQQIAQLSSNVTLTDAAKVELEALEREATANRELYQDLLGRNKATDQLALLARDNVRIVSPAVAPINSTRPSLKLLLPVIAFLSLAMATTLVVAINFGTLRKPAVRQVRAARPRIRKAAAAATAPTPSETVAPVRRGTAPRSLLDAAARAAPRHQTAHEPRGRLIHEDMPYDPYAARR